MARENFLKIKKGERFTITATPTNGNEFLRWDRYMGVDAEVNNYFPGEAGPNPSRSSIADTITENPYSGVASNNETYVAIFRKKNTKSDIDRMIEDYAVMPVILGYTQFVDANGSSDGGGVYKQEYALALLSKGPAPRLSGTNPPDVSIRGFGDLHTLAKVGTGNTDSVVPQGIATIPMCHNYKTDGLAKLQEYMDKKRIMYYFIDSAHENATVGKETRFGKTVKFNTPVNRDEFPREDIMEQIHEEFYRSGLRNYPSVLANEVVITIGSDTYTIPKDDLSEVFMYYFQDWFMLSNPKVVIRQDIGSDPQDRYKKFLGGVDRPSETPSVNSPTPAASAETTNTFTSEEIAKAFVVDDSQVRVVYRGGNIREEEGGYGSEDHGGETGNSEGENETYIGDVKFSVPEKYMKSIKSFSVHFSNSSSQANTKTYSPSEFKLSNGMYYVEFREDSNWERGYGVTGTHIKFASVLSNGETKEAIISTQIGRED